MDSKSRIVPKVHKSNFLFWGAVLLIVFMASQWGLLAALFAVIIFILGMICAILYYIETGQIE